MVECCGLYNGPKCEKVLGIYVGTLENGISHGLCRKCELQTLKDADCATAAEILELEGLLNNESRP